MRCQMKKVTIDKKGFSLIELLATILLISLVPGEGRYGCICYSNNTFATEDRYTYKYSSKV